MIRHFYSVFYSVSKDPISVPDGYYNVFFKNKLEVNMLVCHYRWNNKVQKDY